jgi:hypothetical protein
LIINSPMQFSYGLTIGSTEYMAPLVTPDEN